VRPDYIGAKGILCRGPVLSMRMSLSGKEVNQRDLLDFRYFCAPCVGVRERYLLYDCAWGAITRANFQEVKGEML